MTAIPKIGKRGERNIRINKFLKETAIAQNLPETCEAEYLEFRNRKGERICKRNTELSWAHAKRRPRWTDERDEVTAGLLCIPCHTHAQGLGNDLNEQIILEIEQRRGWSFADFLLSPTEAELVEEAEEKEVKWIRREELELNRVY